MREYTDKNEIITLQKLIMNTELPEELEALKEQFTDPVSFCPKYVFKAKIVWGETGTEVQGELYPRKGLESAFEELSKLDTIGPEQVKADQSEEYYMDLIDKIHLPLYPLIYDYPFWKKEYLTLPEILGSQIIMETVEDYGLIPFLTNVMSRLNSQREDLDELEDYDLESIWEEATDDTDDIENDDIGYDAENNPDEEFEEEIRKGWYWAVKEMAEEAREMRKIGEM